jgi:hypothetical protein
MATQPSITFFSADPPEVNFGGECELSWEADADHCLITPGDGKMLPASGSVFVRPEHDQVYTLTAKKNGKSRSSQFSVTVNRPIVRRFETDRSGDWAMVKQDMTLSWEVEHADSVILDPGGLKQAPMGSLRLDTSTPFIRDYVLKVPGAVPETTKRNVRVFDDVENRFDATYTIEFSRNFDDGDDSLLLTVTGYGILKIELYFDRTNKLVSPADLSLNPLFKLNVREYGDRVGIITIFESNVPAVLENAHFSAFPYRAGSRPGATQSLTREEIRDIAWLGMHVIGANGRIAEYQNDRPDAKDNGDFFLNTIGNNFFKKKDD